MTDAEILKRVAEIESQEWMDFGAAEGYEPGYVKDFTTVAGRTQLNYWNPLTNGSDLLPLIEKYKPNMLFWGSDNFHEKYRDKWSAELDKGEGVNVSLPHAVLLAIIEAHK